MNLVFYIALTLTVFLFLALLLAPVILRPSPAARRIIEMVQSNRPDERNVGSKERMQENDSVPGQASPGPVWLTEDEKTKQQLLSAGIRSRRSMNAYCCQPLYWSPDRSCLRKSDSQQHGLLGLVSGRRAFTLSRTCG